MHLLYSEALTIFRCLERITVLESKVTPPNRCMHSPRRDVKFPSENGRHSVCVPSLSAVAVLSDDASSICKNR